MGEKAWYEVLLGYLMQETTYVGIFAMLKAFKVKVSEALQTSITAFCIALANLILTIIDEVKANKAKKTEENK